MRLPSDLARWGPAALLGVMLGAAIAPRGAAAQDDPRLVDIVRAAQGGQIDSAQQALNGILASTTPTDTLYPQVLYTQGVIARGLDERRRAFTRISVEYANSAWADDAILQLALLDYAAGNREEAARKLTRLKADYPESPIMATASYWAARTFFELHKPQEACSWLTDGLARVGDDIETRNQLSWLAGRCKAPLAQDSGRTDSTGSPPKARPQGTTPAPGAGPGAGTAPVKRTGYGVQVGAVNTQAMADKMVGSLTSAGFTGYIVKEGGLFKVRAGPYPDRSAAMAALPAIRKAMAGSPFLVKEP